MTRSLAIIRQSILIAGRLLIALSVTIAARSATADPTPAAVAAFNSYISVVESRLANQHRSQNGFLAPAAADPKAATRPEQIETRLRRGDLIIDNLTPCSGADLPGAMLHHWRGTAFAPAVAAVDFERLMKDFNAYPHNFSPQVLKTRVLAQQDDHLQVTMRVRQQRVLIVVLDTSYVIEFGRLDPQHGYSLARSTRIAEIASPGTSAEHALDSAHEHGLLWRQNTYWSFEERDGGLYMQIESVSLSRSIPRGLGWAVGPFVESIPRESLEFTLRSVCKALRR
jgi:hypothetical protein